MHNTITPRVKQAQESFKRRHIKCNRYSRAFNRRAHPETREQWKIRGINYEKGQLANNRRHALAMLRIHKVMAEIGWKVGDSINNLRKLAGAKWQTCKIAVGYTYEVVLGKVRQAFIQGPESGENPKGSQPSLSCINNSGHKILNKPLLALSEKEMVGVQMRSNEDIYMSHKRRSFETNKRAAMNDETRIEASSTTENGRSIQEAGGVFLGEDLDKQKKNAVQGDGIRRSHLSRIVARWEGRTEVVDNLPLQVLSKPTPERIPNGLMHIGGMLKGLNGAMARCLRLGGKTEEEIHDFIDNKAWRKEPMLREEYNNRVRQAQERLSDPNCPKAPQNTTTETKHRRELTKDEKRLYAKRKDSQEDEQAWKRVSIQLKDEQANAQESSFEGTRRRFNEPGANMPPWSELGPRMKMQIRQSLIYQKELGLLPVEFVIPPEPTIRELQEEADQRRSTRR